MEDNFPKAIICDLDGTLALLTDREPFEWDQVLHDKVNEPIKEMLNLFHRNGYQILLVSGRDTSAEKLTQDWLKGNTIKYDKLFLRPIDDNQSNSNFKRDLFRQKIIKDYHVKFVIEDMRDVTDMYRTEFGLTVFQV